jgi:hypothetical protein
MHVNPALHSGCLSCALRYTAKLQGVK